MADYIVFKTEDWPEVVRLLRCRSFWREDAGENLIDGAIQILKADKSVEADQEALAMLDEALEKARPHPSNPGRWYFGVDVAEGLAQPEVMVMTPEAMEKLDKDFLSKAGAVRPYRPPRYDATLERHEKERGRLLLLGLKDKVLGGMKAFRIPEEDD